MPDEQTYDLEGKVHYLQQQISTHIDNCLVEAFSEVLTMTVRIRYLEPTNIAIPRFSSIESQFATGRKRCCRTEEGRSIGKSVCS